MFRSTSQRCARAIAGRLLARSLRLMSSGASEKRYVPHGSKTKKSLPVRICKQSVTANAAMSFLPPTGYGTLKFMPPLPLLSSSRGSWVLISWVLVLPLAFLLGVSSFTTSSLLKEGPLICTSTAGPLASARPGCMRLSVGCSRLSKSKSYVVAPRESATPKMSARASTIPSPFSAAFRARLSGHTTALPAKSCSLKDLAPRIRASSMVRNWCTNLI